MFLQVYTLLGTNISILGKGKSSSNMPWEKDVSSQKGTYNLKTILFFARFGSLRAFFYLNPKQSSYLQASPVNLIQNMGWYLDIWTLTVGGVDTKLYTIHSN